MQFCTRFRWMFALLVMASITLAACTPAADSIPATTIAVPAADSTVATSTVADSSTFPVAIDSCGIITTYEQPPERLVSLNSNVTWVLLALGLQDKIVGISGIGRNPVPPEYADTFAGLNIITDGNPSHEVVYS